MTEKYVESSRGRTYYWTAGSGKTALVMLHGLSADHTLFEKQVEYFSPRCRVIVWDNPAHARSRPYRDFSYDNCAEELLSILDAEHIEKPLLVGQSMGGYVIQAFLAAYPQRCAGFVGIDTCPFGAQYYSKSDLWWLCQVGWLSRLYPDGILQRGIAASCSRTAYARANMTAALSYYTKKELCALLDTGYRAFIAANRELSIPCPVLLLVGEYNRTGKVHAYCNAWSRACGYELQIIKGAAHNSNADAPEQVNAAIESFLCVTK